jgi:hypothetical protein
VTFAYDPRVAAQLERHGIRPAPSTRPALAREQLNDLYRHEIRALRRQVRARQFPRAEYADRVIGLRKRYWLLSVPVEDWTRSP